MEALFKDKTILDCLKTSNKFTQMFLASKWSGTLSNEDIFTVIYQYGFIDSLIFFHLNERKNDKIFLEKFIKKFYQTYYKTYEIDYNMFDVVILYKILEAFDSYKDLLDSDIHSDILIDIIRAIIIQDDNLSIETLINFVQKLKEYDKSFDFLTKSLWILYKSYHRTKEENKELLSFAIKISGVFYQEYDKDSFIAYKGIKADNTSTMSSRVRYDVGKTYMAVCDKTDVENSYGLSVWDYANARIYCPEKLIKVKINYKDLHYISILDGKIRTNKFEVLEEVK